MSRDVKFIGFQDTSARNEVYQVFAELDVRLSNFIGRRGGDGVELTLTMIRKRQNFMGSYDGSAALSYENFRSDIEKQHFVSRSGGGGRPMTEEKLAFWRKLCKDWSTTISSAVVKTSRTLPGLSQVVSSMSERTSLGSGSGLVSTRQMEILKTAQCTYRLRQYELSISHGLKISQRLSTIPVTKRMFRNGRLSRRNQPRLFYLQSYSANPLLVNRQDADKTFGAPF